MTTLPRSFVPDAPPVLPNASRIGLIVFMAVATTLFSLLLFAYAMRMREPDWQPIPHPALLWWNTGALVLASIAMQRARQLTSLHRAAWLVSSGVLAAVFVIGQLTAWRMLSAAGQTVTVNPSNSFLYLLTGLHGLHVLGGLVAWAVTIAHLQRADPFRVQRAIALCAIYWHFLLAVWLVLLAAMWWITPEFVAAICGPLYGAAP
jgi:cytochrome c oxidase subunit III